MEEKIVALIDIDGTVSIVGNRLHHLQEKPPKWDKFFEACNEDEPNLQIIKIVELLHFEYNIVFCTGRPEAVRAKTVDWIYEHMPFLGDDSQLLMRKDGDFRHDSEVKPWSSIGGHVILLVFR